MLYIRYLMTASGQDIQKEISLEILLPLAVHRDGLAQDLGPFPQREAHPPQAVITGGKEHPPHKGLVIQGQLGPRHFRRPRPPGRRSSPPDQVLDKLPRPPPARRGPWPKAWLVADRISREGANEIVPGEGAVGPRSRLVLKTK